MRSRGPRPEPDAARAKRLVEMLRDESMSIAVAESLTGGLLALSITEAPGSGGVFRGGLVAYLNGVKRDLLSVPPGPVVSAQCAAAMASGITRLLDADVGIATTGVAGPETLEGRPVGTVFVGVSVRGSTEAQQWLLGTGRDPRAIRAATVDAATQYCADRLAPRVAQASQRGY